jgi:hypothetical protein
MFDHRQKSAPTPGFLEEIKIGGGINYRILIPRIKTVSLISLS